MIIEQALMNLPETMVGAGFGHKNYEGSIVSAFSLAILQSLNSRNIPNPMSCIIAEYAYERTQSKNLRVDLKISLGKTFLGTRAYSNYGFRFENFIEAKYYQLSQSVTNTSKSNPTQNTVAVLKDIIRLILLPTTKHNNNKSNIGRYFLHVYEGGDIGKHLSFTKRKKTERIWLKNLTTQGDFDIKLDDIKEDDYEWWKLLNISKLEINVTNYRISSIPIANNQIPNTTIYTYLLTRINSFSVCIGNSDYTLELDSSMNIKESMSSTTKKADDNSFTSTYPNFESLLSTSIKTKTAKAKTAI
ncbi:TPA: hypothetical protein ACU8BN_000350 [Neisseria subflava]|jgi:hypothetical protein|uniref:hypothetical protein n=1 Tax=uncultured Neisseria sp. TaxID=237778 RepID=UPI0025F3120F|nr:hypothetical protein [uncultured Neisseria sp.]